MISGYKESSDNGGLAAKDVKLAKSAKPAYFICLAILCAIALAVLCSGSARAEEGTRAMWDIAPNWSCYFIQEFHCASEGKFCSAGAQPHNRDLKLDFAKEAISYVGGGTFRIENRLHLPALRKSFFVQGQTEYLFQGGILWRTFLPSYSGKAFHLQAYRCAPG